MAEISESSITLAAHKIVADFVDNNTSLNEGVLKEASSLGLNQDQVSRLIERTNTEAFLKMFPNTDEFELADPVTILGGADKVASLKDSDGTPMMVKKSNYTEILNMTPNEIFGITEEQVKEASYDYALSESDFKTALAYELSKKEELEETLSKTAAELEKDDAYYAGYSLVKQATCRGMSLRQVEEHALCMYPEQSRFIRGVVDQFAEKLASECIPKRLLDRAESIEPKVMYRNEMSDAFGRLINAWQ